MNNTYTLLLKTGQSEIRAIQNLSQTEGILPIIELTRGRTSKSDKIGLIEKKITQIAECFSKNGIILDLTSEKSLSNSQIDDLYRSENGYENWITFLKEIKNKFKDVYPTILINIDDQSFEENLESQIKKMTRIFNGVTYRCNIEDEGYIDDIDIIRNHITGLDKFFFVIDSSYIRHAEFNNCRDKSIEIINNVSNLIKNVIFIITSTSFPDKIGEDDYDTINLTEIELYNQIIKKYPKENILYGDYGSINPIRNDNVIMANGWRPRIDVPLETEIYYHRRRKTTLGYSGTYSLVAEEVVNNPKFPKKMNNNWGITQIINAADDASPGSSPSFWISVRVNIHIEQQLKRLGLFHY